MAYAHLHADRKSRQDRAHAPASLNWPLVGAAAFSAGVWFALFDLGRRLF